MRTQVVLVLISVVTLGCGESKEHKNQRVAKEAAVVMQEALSKAFPGIKTDVDRQIAKANWRVKYKVSSKDIETLEAQFNHRSDPDDNRHASDVWDTMSPTEFAQKYPPVTDKEWFKAVIHTKYGSWRDFQRPISFGSTKDPFRLALTVWIYTIPKKPIKTYRGQLTIIDNKGEVLLEKRIDETPDVSFVDSTIYTVTIDPYDDGNAAHRSLRFTEPADLRLVFVPISIVYADGIEQHL